MNRQLTPSNDVQLSKSLSWLLRHGAAKEGLELSPEGYIAVDKILQHRTLKKWNVEDVKRVVETSDKQRFTLRLCGTLEIKANQGHSIKAVNNLQLVPITSIEQAKEVVHGTYLRCWDAIKETGLSRMNRNHIHFAKGLPSDRGVISGMRRNCQIWIYIDVVKALHDGIEFFLSENGVILSAGNVEGFVLPKYFLKVINAKDGANLLDVGTRK